MTAKFCSRCGLLQSLCEFVKDARRKDGHTADCKHCRRLLGKAYRHQAGVKIAAYHRRYYEANRLAIIARTAGNRRARTAGRAATRKYRSHYETALSQEAR